MDKENQKSQNYGKIQNYANVDQSARRRDNEKNNVAQMPSNSTRTMRTLKLIKIKSFSNRFLNMGLFV
jgi:hypothetical protein